MNVLGLGIVVTCQVVSRYVLGFTPFTADFVAGGVIGLILGTIFRFLAYRHIVFNKITDKFEPTPAPLAQPSSAMVGAGRTR